jgi:uncharacterized protein (DUF1778 family)
MSSTTRTKDDRINLRLKHSAKLKLERAASFEGQTVSKFVLSSALARAEETIQKQEIISLNRKDSEAFFNALAAPVRFNNKLLAAFEEHDQRVSGK